MRRVESARPWLPPTRVLDAALAGEPAYPPWPHSVRPRQGLAGGCAPCAPPNGTARVMSAGCAVWVKIRTSATTRGQLARLGQNLHQSRFRPKVAPSPVLESDGLGRMSFLFQLVLKLL